MEANGSHMCWKSGSLPDPCSLCRPERGCLRTAKPRPSLSDCQSVELPICFSKKLFLLYIQEDLTGALYPSCLRRYFVSRALCLLMGQSERVGQALTITGFGGTQVLTRVTKPEETRGI